MTFDISRRRFIQLAGSSSGAIAGCAAQSEPTPNSGTPSDTPEPTGAVTTSTGRPTNTPRAEPDTIFVDNSAGSDTDEGTPDTPVESIQEGLNRANPGQTVYVLPGRYTGTTETVRDGSPGDPITITGPPEAVVRPAPNEPDRWGFNINHSHIHLTGLTFDGYADENPSNDPDAYGMNAIVAKPPVHESSYPDYLTDVKIKPHAIGNTRRRHVNTYRVNHLEIGEFEIIGPAGLAFTLAETDEYHIGAIIATGRSSNNFGTDAYPWDGPDESHDIHIHHVANLEGYDHTEFVKTHAGNYDVTVEYCTNLGGSGRRDSPGTGASVQLVAGRSTVRWNVLNGGDEHGVMVYVPSMKENDAYEAFESIPEERFAGVNNAIYGNEMRDNGERAISYSSPDWIDNGPDAQAVVCGNEVNGHTDGTPDDSCPSDVPESDPIGYLGGKSPFT